MLPQHPRFSTIRETEAKRSAAVASLLPPMRATRTTTLTTRGSEDETMAQFMADIAGMLELFAIAAGLVLLHRAGKEAPAKLLNVAGWALVTGGMVVGACTTFYWFKYRSRGELDSVHMGYPGMMHAPATGMGTGAMGHGMTGPGMGSMPRGMTPPPQSDGAR